MKVWLVEFRLILGGMETREFKTREDAEKWACICGYGKQTDTAGFLGHSCKIFEVYK